MNPFFIQIRKYTLRQIMNMPLLPKPKTPLPLLTNSKDSVKPKTPVILCEKCKKNALPKVKKAIEESIKFR